MRNLVNILMSPLYLLFAFMTASAVFVSAVLLPNRALVFSLWTDPSVSFRDKIAVPVNILGSIATNFSPLSASYTIAIAVLVGINAAFIVYLLKNDGVVWGGSSAGVAGIFSGVLGIGCAACGSLILMSFLGTIGGVSVLALLPLKGEEFGVIGVILLSAATYLLARQINRPLVCEITTVHQ